MLWQKLSLSSVKNTRGSAAVDFVIVLVPTSLLCLPLIGLMSVFHQSIVNQQQVYEIARFASLADTSSASAEQFRNSTDSTSSIQYIKNQLGCVVSVSKQASYRVPFWPNAIAIDSEARVRCEVG